MKTKALVSFLLITALMLFACAPPAAAPAGDGDSADSGGDMAAGDITIDNSGAINRNIASYNQDVSIHFPAHIQITTDQHDMAIEVFPVVNSRRLKKAMYGSIFGVGEIAFFSLKAEIRWENLFRHRRSFHESTSSTQKIIGEVKAKSN